MSFETRGVAYLRRRATLRYGEARTEQDSKTKRGVQEVCSRSSMLLKEQRLTTQ